MELLVLAIDRLTPEFLKRPLEPLGYGLTAFQEADALKSWAAARPPKAIFLPRRLPGGGDARKLVAWLKEHAATKAVPLLLLGLTEADRALARELGCDGYLAVPFSDRDVVEILGASTRKRRLIVLVDDSPLIHRHTVPLLEEAGYDVVSAYDGEEARARIDEVRPDLVITDVEMPRLDGYGLCKAVKHAAATSHLPVIICSALGEAADLERGFDAGADDYLVKPVLPEELTTRVRYALSGSRRELRDRILVVDDSPAQRHYVEDCLVRQGFEVITAENGRVGLEKARTVSPRLVVSDYDMPELNGFEMVHALKRDPATRDIPVIMLTARESRRDVAQMRAAGATAYLVKPFAQDKCIATVERTLAERQLYAYKEESRVYMPDSAVKAAEERAQGIGTVRADAKVMSVLFSDICGFTNMSSQMQPREVVELLNDYFDRLCPIVKAFGGEIDKFIGDAIMAEFEDLRDQEPAPVRAIRAALAMQAAMPGFNASHAQALQMRIGINTGPLVHGDVGSRYVRLDRTVIGDTVNRANRYEANAPKGGVLISESTLAVVRDLVEVEPLPGLKLKGLAEPVTGFVVRSIRAREDER